MHVLLLIAGQSTRFWPLDGKQLFPICGKTLLEHQIERLQSAGLENITLVGGAHNLEEIGKLYPDLPCIEQEDLSLGMRGALLSALPSCGDEPVMIVSGNDVIEPSGYKNLLESAGSGGALLAQKVDTYFPGGYLTVNDNRVTGIVEKPGEGNEPSDLVNIVAHVHSQPQKLLEALQNVDESTDDGYEQALQKLLDDYEYTAVPYEDVWRAVKYPWHMIPLLPELLSAYQEPSIHKSASVHETAILQGSVYIDEGVKIFPHAVISGPCYIGKRSVVGNNALVRGSSIGDDCVVGYNTEIKDSVLHSHVWTHSTYLGESVIGSNVAFGAGCVTGNLRLDEKSIPSHVGDDRIDTGLTKLGTVIGKNSRLGIQVSIDPGVKIGGGTFVSSASHVSKDIPDRSFAIMKSGELSVRENFAEAPRPECRDEYRNKVL